MITRPRREDEKSQTGGCGVLMYCVLFVIITLLNYLLGIFGLLPEELMWSASGPGLFISSILLGAYMLLANVRPNVAAKPDDVFVTDAVVIKMNPLKLDGEGGRRLFTGYVTLDDPQFPVLDIGDEKRLQGLCTGDFVNVTYHPSTGRIIELRVRRTFKNGKVYRLSSPIIGLDRKAKSADGSDVESWKLGETLKMVVIKKSLFFGKLTYERIGMKTRVVNLFFEKEDSRGDVYNDDWALIVEGEDFDHISATYAAVEDVQPRDVVYVELGSDMKLLRLRVLERPGVADASQLPAEWASNNA